MRILLLLLCSMTLQMAIAQKLTHKISSEEGKCSLAFPAEPTEQQKEIAGYNTVLFIAMVDGTVYLFSYSNIPVPESEQDGLLQATKRGFMESVKMSNQNEKTVYKGKIKGLYCEGFTEGEENLNVRYEVYYHNDVIYQIGIMQANTMPEEKAMKAFTKTFKIKK